MIRSRDAPVISCHIHEKFPAPQTCQYIFYVYTFPYRMTIIVIRMYCWVELWCIPRWKPNQVNSCNSSSFKIPMPILTQIIHYKKYVASVIQKRKSILTVIVAEVQKFSGYMTLELFNAFLCVSVFIWHICTECFHR